MPRETFAALFYIFLWASAFIPSRVLSVESPPLWVLVIRFAIGGALLLGYVLVRKLRFPATLREWGEIALLGVLTNAAYLGLSYIALQHLSSGMATIIASTNPLVLAAVAPFTIGERLSARRVSGLVLGFLGVVAIMIARAGSPSERPADALIAFAGVVAFVGSTVLYKKMSLHTDLGVITAIQVVAASVALLPFALLLEGRPRLAATPETFASMAYLIVVMTIGATFLWFGILRRGEATRVSAYYFLTPVFGLALSALLLHEPLQARDAIGLVAICSGIAIVARPDRRALAA